MSGPTIRVRFIDALRLPDLTGAAFLRVEAKATGRRLSAGRSPSPNSLSLSG
jgi:hypothetical protein